MNKKNLSIVMTVVSAIFTANNLIGIYYDVVGGKPFILVMHALLAVWMGYMTYSCYKSYKSYA